MDRILIKKKLEKIKPIFTKYVIEEQLYYKTEVFIIS